MNMDRSFRRSRAILAMLFLLSLIVPLVIAEPSSAAQAKIEAQVQTELAANKQANVWIILRSKANLKPAFAIKDWAARGRFVYQRLQANANASQAGVRGLLQSRGAKQRSFFIVNAIKATADSATINEIARRAEVEKIVADGGFQIPQPLAGTSHSTIENIEWNIDHIRAPEVWTTFGDRGEGIVVANIDTGVEFNHPALVAQYRGNQGNNQFNHDYNWYDPTAQCGAQPCDNNDHGTHTMGTMVGGGSAQGENQIGVAPGARWIAAKGCESFSCSFEALMASGEWMLAPTDQQGQNPRPDLRPHIVNNSWGGASGNAWYQSLVQAWVAAGIFPAFSNGNNGPSCRTAGSPGDYPESYATGAHDINNQIASFSSRGSSRFGITKPNIAAPGVDVRSSVPGGYGIYSGTSMAAPHVAATVALVWSASPVLLGDIDATRALLDQTAIDVLTTECQGAYPGPGGSGNANNVWGEGRLDAFAAVQEAPRGPVGILRGTVTDGATQTPVPGATIRVTGTTSRTTETDGTGSYTLNLPVGTYQLEVSSYGYLDQTLPAVVVGDGATTVQDVALAPAPAQALTGYVRGVDGSPLAHASVTILDTPLAPVTTDDTGFYRFERVLQGTYEVQAVANACTTPQTLSVTLDADKTLNFALPTRTDSYGYACQIVPASYIDASTPLELYGDDASARVELPFSFPFYGQGYTSAYVTTNGFLNFLAPNTNWTNGALPNPAPPNAAIYPFWDDLYVDGSSSVRTEVVGSAPNRQFVIEWRDVSFHESPLDRIRAEVVLHENGQIVMQYAGLDNLREQGNSATVGIENEDGTAALQFSSYEAALFNGLALRYRLPPNGFIEGQITDANDGQPVANATVQARQNETTVRVTTTNDQGRYRLQVPLGSYTIAAAAANYSSEAAEVSIPTDGSVVSRDFVLRTARPEVRPTALQFIATSGQTKTANLTLRNSGSQDLTWDLLEDSSWLAASPVSGRLAPGAVQTIQVTVTTNGLPSNIYHDDLLLNTNSARQPAFEVPIELIVPAYRQAVEAGGSAYTDRSGELWAADRQYTAGSWGYIDARARAATTNQAIAGTDDDPLYQSARVSPAEYRFDNLPSGVYQVELRFAEIQNQQPNTRVFDVLIEDTKVLESYDIAVAAPGKQTAVDRSFFVTVVDGNLNLRFVGRRGYAPPLVNAIRVTQRPDR